MQSYVVIMVLLIGRAEQIRASQPSASPPSHAADTVLFLDFSVGDCGCAQKSLTYITPTILKKRPM